MRQLQEDAVRRAREMQSRARIPPRQQQRSGPRQSQEPPRQEQPRPTPEPISAGPQPDGLRHDGGPAPQQERASLQETEAAAPNGLLESLFQDKERTIILALLILLSGEESNHELMFALMFLLM